MVKTKTVSKEGAKKVYKRHTPPRFPDNCITVDNVVLSPS